MKMILVCLSISIASAVFAAPMARVVAITDSRTIVVNTNGIRTLIAMSGVTVPADEEVEAAEFLRRTCLNAWVYVENGDVYRSPDGLYINEELSRRAWRTSPGMKYLGDLDLGSRAKNQPVGNKASAAPEPGAPQVIKPVRRGSSASPSKSRRAARAQ